jgi:hypothetical protein
MNMRAASTARTPIGTLMKKIQFHLESVVFWPAHAHIFGGAGRLSTDRRGSVALKLVRWSASAVQGFVADRRRLGGRCRGPSRHAS